MQKNLNQSYQVRVRIAPSPTGNFHIGTARTALFNYLFAKHHNGKFLLRIEDTDKKRSTKKFEKNIIDGLKWLSLNWDEKITYQSQRAKIYQEYLDQLIKEKKAYYCFCAKERLEKLKKNQTLNKQAPGYDGKCKKGNLTEKEKWQTIRFNSAKYFQENQKTVLEYQDLIHGKLKFTANVFDDFVIVNRTGALYNFANVIDDHSMKITHILRGEDHISNTPKQIMLYSAFGWKLPQFAHFPLILNPDRTKMSKRAGDTRLKDYIQKGYLPSAIINFLALLGWNPKTTEELFSLTELIKKFEIKNLNKAGAIFNIEKLNWFNAKYIKALDSQIYFDQAKQYLPNSDWTTDPRLNGFLLLIKDRLKKFSDIPDLVQFFFTLPEYKPELLIWKDAGKEKIKQALEIGESELKKIKTNQFTQKYLEPILKKTTEKNKLTNGEFFWPLRTALSGLQQSPSPFEILQALGREESLKRIQKAIEMIREL